MKLIILLAAIAWSNGAKLDNAYLPPSYAQTSGGSGNFLQTPVSGRSNDYQRSQFGQGPRGPSRSFGGNNYGQGNTGFAQTGNELAQPGNGFPQAGNFGQTGNGFAQDNNDYAQNANSFAQSGNARNLNDFGNFEGRPERAQAAFERNAAILRLDDQNDGETFAYAYETENGIVAEESGVATNGVEAQGGFSYTGDDGQVYSIRYTADQNGFVPQGDHLPTPPPIPEEILRALEQNARDEAAGIYDDGSYDEAKYGSGDSNGQYNTNNNYDSGNNYNSGTNYNSGNNYNSGDNFNNAANADDDTVVTTNALFTANQSGFRNQASNRGSNIPTYNQGFRNQAGAGNQGFRNQGGNNQGGFQTSGFRSAQGSFGNQADNGVNKAYLPPVVSQRGQNSGFGRRQPSFSARNGYQY